MTATSSALRQLVHDAGLTVGTHPENLAAWRLLRAGHSFEQQIRVGGWRIDIAFPDIMLAIEIDGPHHHQPLTAARDTLRDADLRARGWLVIRLDTASLEERIADVSAIAHLMKAAR